MSTMDFERQLKAEDLAHAKRMIETTLEGWELLTWNELLADDVILSLKSGPFDISSIGELGGVGGNLEVIGRQEAKDVLKSIYGDLRKDLSVTTEVISGYDAFLLGNLTVHKASENVQSLPIAIYLAFNSQAKIQKMTITIVDLRVLTAAIRKAVQSGWRVIPNSP